MPFELPSIGPTDCDDCEAFESFETALRSASYSRAVGWLVRLRALLVNTEGKQFVLEKKASLRASFGMKIRSTVGWAVCLLFVDQVSSLMFEFTVPITVI